MEQPFFDRLAPDEVTTGSREADYDLTKKADKYVGWFGIVREISEDEAAQRTMLTVEHKYFDGLTDLHLLAVSFNGAGDFRARLAGTGHRIPPLSLVKVYGKVVRGKPGDKPQVDAELVRDWHWGTFTFVAAYGTQRGNQKWREANTVPLEDIYESWPHPSHRYYEERLGKRPDAPQIRRRLIEAAGPVAPEARRAMERLADLLALGHTWSQAETMRQSRELSEIHEIVTTTGARQPAVALLFEALCEDDERISWSASEQFSCFDPEGDAIEGLVRLLDDASPRVRAGAARALSSGYGAKAAAAVASLSRCVADDYPDLKQYSIFALKTIGPGAKSALPALRSAARDEDPAVRLMAAGALWDISREPDDVVSVCAAILESDDDEACYGAAEQLKQMGPWGAAAVGPLIDALQAERWTVRSSAAEALGEIGVAAARAVPALSNVLENDEHSIVQSNAAEALGKIHDRQAIPVLTAALEIEDEYVRSKAIGALEAFGAEAKAAIPALVRAVNSDEANGCLAASALGAIDIEGASVPVLIEALASDDARLRRYAARGLGRMGRAAAAAEIPLRDRLQDGDAGARIAAAAAYWHVAGDPEAPVRVLRSALKGSGNWQAQMRAADALAEVGPPARGAVPELVGCLNSDTRYVVTSAARALGKIGSDAGSAVPALTTRLDAEKDDYTRVSLARALWGIENSDKSLPILQAALANSRDFMALAAAAEAIGEMGPAAASAAPLLQPLLKDESSLVREAAAEALRRIEQK